MVKDVFSFAEELGIELNFEHPRTVKTELRNCQVENVEEEVRSQRWRGSLVTTGPCSLAVTRLPRHL